ncbi:interferon-induced helicase C domain-containing protein 1 [Brienomyrus brachyistius]|uniref:interferon-induced helicase C domain-containing protein 1 n=1 Tax=Brienomyrus brachyistius TaxID=42636 RepID=UPI0020B2D4B8|nr:interferon-induced helicase C domain-containing protein 1 [Brienomyrus brachyistius]
MESSADEVFLWLIYDCFRNRLRSLIQIEPVLDRLTFIERDQKDLILNKAKKESNQLAVDLLIDTIHKGPRPPGWYRELTDALNAAGCQHAAMYMETENLPSASSEAVNDYCVKLIDLLAPSLQEIKTPDVCTMSFAQNILTEDDKEIVMAACTNYGNRTGARELLRKIVQKPPGWFSTFLDVLRQTEHFDLVHELTGLESTENHNDSVCEGNVKPEAMTHEPDLKKNDNDNDQSVRECTNNGEETLNTSLDNSSCDTTLNGSTDAHPANSLDSDLYSSGGESLSASPLGLTLNESNRRTPDCAESGAMTGAGRDTEIVLRPYQREVARPALEGKNIIVCLPTGSGKTRVAVYITKEHLDGCRQEKRPGKVVVLVNKVPLVEQHYTKEFGKYLKGQYRVEKVSGDSQLKISFPEIVKKNDIIICTAQILENFLEKAEKSRDEGVNLSDFSMAVIDECHHTQKGSVYSQIMFRYLKQKIKNEKLVKEQNAPMPLPQILGLTASPGVGEAKTVDKAVEHILQICANLDAFRIMTSSLGEHRKEPYKRIATAAERKEDPFGDVIKGIMNAIHTHANLDPSCELGTQNYEQWVVQKEQNAAKEENRKVRVCAAHLRQYNEALHQSNTIRMSDACSFLEKFYSEESEKKMAPEEVPVQITDTDRFLFQLFRDNQAKLQELAKHPEYENKTLAELKTIILREFTGRVEARGIVFTKTRLSAIALSQWIQENSKFEEVGVRASHLIGGGDQSIVKPMTPKEQKEVLAKFHTGEINLLIATSVAEEGLDFPESNIVIRYCLVTNEGAMIQARGRGRAEDSSYTVVQVEGSGVAERETVNEFRENMMGKAIEKIQKIDQAEYERKKREFQLQTIMEKKVRKKKKQQKLMQNLDPGEVSFSCRNCSKAVCSGMDVEIIGTMHHVNVSEEFRELFTVRKNPTLRERQLDFEANSAIACKDCGSTWGSMMLYRGIDCPCLHIKHFTVKFGDSQKVFHNWSELTVRFTAFNYAAHAHLVAGDSDSDD